MNQSLSVGTQFLSNIPRWKRYALALFCGLLGAATLPPVHLFPLLIPAFTGLVLLTFSTERLRDAFWTGWWFGLGYFTAGLYWLAYALLVEPEKFAWMIPFAVLGLPSILAIYYGLACALSRCLPFTSPWPRLFGFSCIWIVIELLRGYLFTGFPWNLIGYSWSFSTIMLQPAWLIGIYGLTLWTVVLASCPAIYWLSQTRNNSQTNSALLLLLAMLLIPYGYGYWRLHNQPTQYTDTTIRVVQANIPQTMKWVQDERFHALEKHVELSMQPRAEEVDLFIWSETAYPFIMEEQTPPIRYISSALRSGQHIITGAIRANADSTKPAHEWNFWNSLHIVDFNGNIAGQYDKRKLVPFGEFVPLRSILPLQKITHGMQDFSVGNGHATQRIKDSTNVFLPLICYEAIFPFLSTLRETHKADWFLNITNDAWFGHSSGPYQHLEMARMRAIEHGIPLVRAANTGISAVIDPYGRILRTLPLEETGVITMKLPLSISKYNDK